MNRSRDVLHLIAFTGVLLVLVGCGATVPAPASAPALPPGMASQSYMGDVWTDLMNAYAQDGYRNCVATPFDVPGQGLHAAGTGLHAAGTGLHAAGTVGGLFIGDPNAPTPPTAASAEVAGYVDGIGIPGPDLDVAILVLDQFSFETPAGERVYAYDVGPEVYGLVDAAQAGDEALQAAFRALRERGQLSHGALVYRHTDEIVAALPGATGSWVNTSPYYPDYKLYVRGGRSLLIHAVDVADLDTDAIAAALTGTIARFQRSGIHRMAVNMSFSIVPCALSELGREYGSIEAYLDDVAASAPPGETFDADLFMNFTSWVTSQTDDPLLRAIAGTYRNDDPTKAGPWIVNREDLVFVAAAGNFGGAAPLLPALASDVLSVSSFDFEDGAISPFSNAGEVAAPGWLFRLDDTFEGKRIASAGTSLAGPVAAVAAALDLAQAASWCFQPGLPSDLLSPGAYDDKPLHDAVAACSR